MKAIPEINAQYVSTIRIDFALEKYDDIVLFPEKLAKANALLKKAGPPKFPEPKK